MNLSKLLIFSLLIQVTTSFCNTEDDIRNIQEVLDAKSKKVEQAEEVSDILKAVNEYNKTVSEITRAYLDLP